MHTAPPPHDIPFVLASALHALAQAKKNDASPEVMEALRAHVYEKLMESPDLLEAAVREACRRIPKGLIGYEEIADVALELIENR